jgi:uncharacterized protein (DUF362 family)
LSQGFLNLYKFFSSEAERKINHLSSVYLDDKQLYASIELIVKDYLNSKTVIGKKIFLKPNWVLQNRSSSDQWCLCTHPNFIIQFVNYLVQYAPSKITIADAPVQGCKWEQLHSAEFYNRIEKISKASNVKIEIKDLRRLVFTPSEREMHKTQNSIDNYVIFDLGNQSFLEDVSEENINKFRVTVYNPDRFLESHAKGMHKYCITKELFDADICISMPKSKTHEKSGITNALKNIVGLNGDKDYLPHHRIGGSKHGGDAYPGKNVVRFFAEQLYDKANRNLENASYWRWIRLASLVWRLSIPNRHSRLGAGWYGNDTTWRMVMDLNKIAYYGRSDGTLGKDPVRKFYSLCDGIIGGQKDGPLTPDPLALGFISFTNDSAWCDIATAILMGMEVNKLKLLVAAKDFSPFNHLEIKLNGEIVQLNDLIKYKIDAVMPGGWNGYDSNT